MSSLIELVKSEVEGPKDESNLIAKTVEDHARLTFFILVQVPTKKCIANYSKKAINHETHVDQLLVSLVTLFEKWEVLWEPVKGLLLFFRVWGFVKGAHASDGIPQSGQGVTRTSSLSCTVGIR